MADPGVIRTENDVALRQFRRRIERRGDMSAVHEPSVRDDSADETLPARGFRIRGEARLHLRPQSFRRSLIKRAGDCGRAGGHSRGKLGEYRIAFMKSVTVPR